MPETTRRTMPVSALILAAAFVGGKRELPAACETLERGRIMVSVDARSISAKQDDGKDLWFSALEHVVAAKLRAAGTDAVSQFDLGATPADSPVGQIVVLLSGDRRHASYTIGGAWSGVGLTGNIVRSPAMVTARESAFTVEWAPPATIAVSRRTASWLRWRRRTTSGLAPRQPGS